MKSLEVKQVSSSKAKKSFWSYLKAAALMMTAAATYALAKGFNPFRSDVDQPKALVPSSNLELKAFDAGSRQLLSASEIKVATPIPDQWVEPGKEYRLDLGSAFSGDASVIGAFDINTGAAPDWFKLESAQGHSGYLDLSSFGYSQGAIAVQDEIAYIACGLNGLCAVDVTRVDAPKLVGNCTLINKSFNNFVIQGELAYVASFVGGLTIINITAPSALNTLGEFGTSFLDVAVKGSVAYAIDFSTLTMIDVSIPAAPTLLGSCAATTGGAQASRVLVQNGLAYVIAKSFRVFNVTQPSQPTLLGEYDQGTFTGGAIQGTTVYLINQTDFQLVDVTNPSAPHRLALYSNLKSTRYLTVQGSVMYAATGTAGLQIFDITTPSDTHLLGGYKTLGGGAFHTVVQGSIAYVGDAIGLSILTVSDPTLVMTPQQTNIGEHAVMVRAIGVNGDVVSAPFQLAVEPLPQRVDAALTGQRVLPGQQLTQRWVSDRLFSHWRDDFLQLSIATADGGNAPDWQEITLQPYVQSSLDTRGWFEGVAVQDGVAYVAGYDVLKGDTGVRIVDVTVPNMPRLLASYNSTGAARHVIVQKGIAYFSAATSGLQIINVTDPSAPSWLGAYDTPPPHYTAPLVNDVAVHGAIAYTVGAKLQLVNVSDPRAPHLIGECDVPGIGKRIVIQDDIAYIASGTGGLQIVDVTVPTALQILGSYPISPPSGVVGIAVQGTMACIAAGQGGLLLLDVTTPGTPGLLATYTTSAYASSVALRGTVAYTAFIQQVGQTQTLEVIDFKVPSKPKLLGGYDTGTNNDIAVVGPFVYVTNRASGLKVVDITAWEFTATPNATHVGNHEVRLTATDEWGGNASDTFTLRVDGPPSFRGTIPQQYAKVGELFNYFIPQGLVSDPNFDPVQFSAVELGKTTLLPWLTLNPFSAAFIGKPLPSDTGNFTILLSATDNIAGTSNTTFPLYIDHAPIVSVDVPRQVLPVDHLYHYVLNPKTFLDFDNDTMTYAASQRHQSALPAWLTFDPNGLVFSGTPNATGDYSLQVTASDPYTGSATAQFELIVASPPELQQPLSPALAGVRHAFSLTVPQRTFEDPAGGSLTYQAQKGDGSDLPHWLFFSPVSLSFTGTPLQVDVGEVMLKVIATTSLGLSANTTFPLTVTHYPRYAVPLSDQLAVVDQLYYFKVPNNTFVDEDLEPLTVTPLSTLPAWLNYDVSDLTFIGIPRLNDSETLTIQLRAEDPHGAAAEGEFELHVKAPPTAVQTLTPQLAGVNQAFSWVVPSTAFHDPVDDRLTYSAALQGGDPLPLWLKFIPQTQTFIGTPLGDDVGNSTLQITVTDPYGLSATQTNSLYVTHFPTVAKPLTDQVAAVDQLFNMTVPSGTFSDVDKDTLTIDISGTGLNSTLPNWLTFNSKPQALLGTPSLNDTGLYGLVAQATDPYGASTSTSFQLRVATAPKVDYPIPAQIAGIDHAFNYIVPGETFSGRNPFGYQAAPLPNWLRFIPATRHFIGTPLESDLGHFITYITATDPYGFTAQTPLELNVIHFPQAVRSVPPLPTLRIDRNFSQVLPNNLFQDALLLHLQVVQSNGLPRPKWLHFNATDRHLWGTPGQSAIGQLSLLLQANNTQGGIESIPFTLSIKPNIPPRIVSRIANQPAAVGNQFSLSIPYDTFVDDNGDNLTYSASSVGGGALPGWLGFDSATRTLSGTPGRGDTKTYADKVFQIEVKASDGLSHGSTTFDINVEGRTTLEWIILIGAPVFSGITFGIALYQNRAFLLNRCRRHRYEEIKETVALGEPYERKLETPRKSIVAIKAKRILSLAGRCCRFFRSSRAPLRGSLDLPYWLDYDARNNTIVSKGSVPEDIPLEPLVIQVEGSDEVVEEEFTLHLTEERQQDIFGEEEEKTLAPEPFV